ncbi:MAG TPA: hypothetical protein DD412_06830 [Holosporales bacterium]|nr:hypothetical protein [Holosporales bacterium]
MPLEIIGKIATHLFDAEGESGRGAAVSVAERHATRYLPGVAGFHSDIKNLLLLGVRLNKPNIREGVNQYAKVPVHLALERDFHRMGLRHIVVGGVSHNLPALQDGQCLSGVLRIFEGQASCAEVVQYLSQHKDLSIEYIGNGAGAAGAAGAVAESLPHERLQTVSLETFWQSNKNLGRALKTIPYDKRLGVRSSILPFLGNPIMDSILRKVGSRNFIHFSEVFSELDIRERMSILSCITENMLTVCHSALDVGMAVVALAEHSPEARLEVKAFLAAKTFLRVTRGGSLGFYIQTLTDNPDFLFFQQERNSSN